MLQFLENTFTLVSIELSLRLYVAPKNYVSNYSVQRLYSECRCKELGGSWPLITGLYYTWDPLLNISGPKIPKVQTSFFEFWPAFWDSGPL